MARIDTLANFLEDVATKIRSKTGSQSTITPANYDTEIEKIKWVVNAGAKICFNSQCSINIQRDDTTTTSVNFKNIDTSNLKKTTNMFQRCVNLTNIDFTDFDTSSIIEAPAMFQKCTSLTSLDLSNFDTSNLEYAPSMFNGCTNLETINFGNNFTFAGITGNGLIGIFTNCTKLDNNTLNSILHICTTATSAYTGTKSLQAIGITDTFDNFDNIPNLSNYQEFIDAGWTILTPTS